MIMGPAGESQERGAESITERAARLGADPAYVRLEGLHCVKHALRFGADLVLLITADRDVTLGLTDLLAPDVRARVETELIEVAPAEAAEVFGNGRFDVVGYAHRPVPGGPAVAAPAVLLEDPRNLGNLGAVVRVAAGLGARAVLTTGTVDPWHPTVVRAAAGLHFAIPVDRVDGLDWSSPSDGPVLALDPVGSDLRGIAIPPNAVLAFGSERHGVSPGLRRRADQLVAIPMREQVSSYNLATSVAMALFHWKSNGGAAAHSR